MVQAPSPNPSVSRSSIVGLIVSNLVCAVLAYVQCVRETGGDWTRLDCMGLTRSITLDIPEGPEQSLVEDLLAFMPEEEQVSVATSILAAQERLIERYADELAELTGSPVGIAT